MILLGYNMKIATWWGGGDKNLMVLGLPSITLKQVSAS